MIDVNMANANRDEYKAVSRSFNPKDFDAMKIARLAKDAGMKYIIITSKHHDGFAMYHSACDKFNIVDATPFGRDPMKELADACKQLGLGFGFYYSHNQDWTTPGVPHGKFYTTKTKKHPSVDLNNKWYKLALLWTPEKVIYYAGHDTLAPIAGFKRDGTGLYGYGNLDTEKKEIPLIRDISDEEIQQADIRKKHLEITPNPDHKIAKGVGE